MQNEQYGLSQGGLLRSGRDYVFALCGPLQERRRRQSADTGEALMGDGRDKTRWPLSMPSHDQWAAIPPGEAPSREWQVDAMVQCARAHCPDSGVGGRDCLSVVWCAGLGGSALLAAQGCPHAPRRGAATHVVGFRPPTDLPRRRWALILGLHALCILPAPRPAPQPDTPPSPERILAPRRHRLPLAERDAACGR